MIGIPYEICLKVLGVGGGLGAFIILAVVNKWLLI